MMFPRFSSLLRLGVLCLTIGLVCITALAGADDWKPIDPADLASKTPLVDKDADAEALFWEVRVADEFQGDEAKTVMSHYVRIKIYSERGREGQSRIDLPFLASWRITDITARTIKPDGGIVELKKADVFERSIIKSSNLKIRAKSFAMPSVEAGSIVEYRWKEVRNTSFHLRLQFQRDVPVRIVKYFIKPLNDPRYVMRAQTFHGNPTPFVKEKDGSHSVTMRDVPAFHEEPRMPPEDQVRPWMLLFYSEEKGNLTAESFWKDFGKKKYGESRARMKVSDEVKQSATSIIGDATAPTQQLERLFEFCRTKIKNINDDASGLTPDERAKLKENKSPADTLKRSMGTGMDIDMLFAALASAAGFEVRVVNLGDRSDIFLDQSFPNEYFIQTYDIAVRLGETWHFYDPASTYVPFGMLRWQEESQPALLSDPKDPVWLDTPLSGPEKSKQKRTATLRLSEDGTIEGDVRIEYYGHSAVERKEWDDDDSPAQREETLRDSVKAQMSTAELSEIKIENITDPVKPFVYVYHVRVPGYAQRTGKRLFLQPAFFEHGIGPLFPASGRTHPVYFHYPWSEADQVTIELPAGFTLDNADAPPPITITQIMAYQPTIGVTRDGKTLVYKRDFFFGGGGAIFFPVKTYPDLKGLFDSINKADNHTITLKQSAASASN
jgi:hypothetical protein